MVHEYLKKKGLSTDDIFSEQGIVQLNGIVYKGENNTWLDGNKALIKNKISQYKKEGITNCIIYPVFNFYSVFSGIVIRKFGDSKHDSFFIDSPETKKGSLLYNLNNCYNDIALKDEVYITEGIPDCVAIKKAGIKNVVSILGTNLSKKQLCLILRYTKNIILALDADSGGSLAGKKIKFNYSKYANFKSVNIIGDPDEYIFKNGINAFTKSVKSDDDILMQRLYNG